MKKIGLIGGLLVTAGCLAMTGASKKDPVLMTIGGKPVTLSEFEYMYHKNNQQQVEEQPLEKYIDMFAVYKMKVAEAEAAGIDTTQAFRKEYTGYRNELAIPYLTDSVALDQEARKIYERMKTNVKASHIMLRLGVSDAENARTIAQLDSIRTCALNGESFEELALKYSIDGSVRQNKGSMGYVSVGRFPYQFEEACYATPVGEISPVFRTDYGYHIVKTYDVRPDAGVVSVEHILKLYPRGATPEQKQSVKEKMDSLYTILKSGADFEQVATKESQDPGSARQGGKLPWFGKGQMVPEFEKVAYELPVDSISKPFETTYGVHIVKKLGHKSLGTYEEMRNQIMALMRRDARGQIGFNTRIAQLKEKFGVTRNESLIDRMAKDVVANGADSTFTVMYGSSTEPLLTVNKQNVYISDLLPLLKGYEKTIGEQAGKTLRNQVDALEINKIVDCEIADLEKQNPDFRNLLHEYRDGMLLFEISNRNVWAKASSDAEGLKAYFEAHKGDYKWTSPRYKGYLIQTTGDSVSNLVKTRLKTLGEDSLMRVLRRDYGKDMKIERVLVAKGENPMVDSEVFGGTRVTPKKDSRYKDYFVYAGRLIAQPEEVSDIRGEVVADYQNYLEDEWVSKLRELYPVEIEKKVLKKVK